eukprot:jgi/Psemu1/37081/gm1.37081_g
MVPPPDAYDWSNQRPLYNSYSETARISTPEMSTLFTSDADGPKVLGLAPVTAHRETMCNIIALDIENLDAIAKGHIVQLINVCPGLHSQQFYSAGRDAVEQAEIAGRREATIIVEFNVNQWKFKKNWKTNDPTNYFKGIVT